MQKDSSLWAVKTDWEGFKLILKGEGDAARLSRDEPKGAKAESGVRSATQLKWMYTNARSKGNKKQEKLEAYVKEA